MIKQDTNTEITRYDGRTNTWVTVPKRSITHANIWHNVHGNPTTKIYVEGGSSILCVDDFGALNNLGSIPRYHVNRKKDL